jgi:predicted PurR-regulated permease PerM
MPAGIPILESNHGPERPERDEFTRRTWIAVVIVVGIAAFIFTLFRATNVFLMAFAGALFAIFLRSLARFVHRWTRIPAHWAVLLVLLVLLGLFAGVCWLVAAPVAQQFDQLSQQVPSAIAELQTKLKETQAGRFILDRAGTATTETRNVSGHIGSFFSLTVESVVGILVILFAGIFFALDPDLYVNGFLLLFPRPKRDRTRQILEEVGVNLQNWLLGQFIVMAILGIATWIGLLIIGVPLAGALGLIAGILDFIPVVGPWIAAILAVLLAVVKEPMMAVWVCVLFVALHFIEGHILIPQVQKFATRLPPVLTILALALFAKLFGFMGLVVATPLLVVVVILVKTMYREDVLQRSGSD